MALIALPTLFGGKSPHGRLIAMLLLLTAIYVGQKRLREFSTGGAPVPVSQQQEYVFSDPVPEQSDPLANIEPLSFLPKGIIGVDVGDDSQDALLRAHDIGGNTIAIEMILGYLKGLTPEKIDIETQNNADYSSAMLMARSDALRGKVMTYFGIVRDVKLVEFPDAEPGLRRMWLVMGENIRRTSFVAVLTPSISRMVYAGQSFAFEGGFLQRYATPIQTESKGPALWQWMPLFVAPQVYADRRPAPPPELMIDPEEPDFHYPSDLLVDKLDPNLVDSIWHVEKDGRSLKTIPLPGVDTEAVKHFEQEVANLLHEKIAFDHLFRYMAHFDDDAIAKKVEPEMTFDYLMTGIEPPPESFYRFAEVTGHALSVKKFEPRGLKSGLPQFYSLIINDINYSNYDYRWTIVCPNLPKQLRVGDRVQVDGLFVKLYPYLNRKYEWMWTPLLVAKNVKIVQMERISPWLIGPISIIAILVFFLWLHVLRKDEIRSQGMLATVRQRTFLHKPTNASHILAQAKEKVLTRRKEMREKNPQNNAPLQNGASDAATAEAGGDEIEAAKASAEDAPCAAEASPDGGFEDAVNPEVKDPASE